MNQSKIEVVVTGTGVATPIGIGRKSFSKALRNGNTNFSKITFERGESLFEYPIAKLGNFDFKEQISKINLKEEIITKAKRLRNISLSSALGTYCALEAWEDACFDASIDLERVVIVSGGTNIKHASLIEIQNKYKEKLQFLNPNYGLNFFDSDIIGVLSEVLGIQGEGHTIGAASASGNMAVIQGKRLINSGEYDVALVVAPLMDISDFEYQGFTALGGMARIEEDFEPSSCYRPFDIKHNGFVYGQSSGCLILESKKHAEKREKKSYVTIAGYGVSMDANRNPNPSISGEKRAMNNAIKNSGLEINEIDYVNTHGTGSIIGDKTEVSAILSLSLNNVKANSTKSLIGHGLSSAGLVEVIASIIQMNEGFLHKSNNLIEAINNDIDWVKNEAQEMKIKHAMSNSFGFGGINTSIILKKE